MGVMTEKKRYCDKHQKKTQHPRESVIKELPSSFPVRVSWLGKVQKSAGTGNDEYVFMFDWFKYD